MSAASKMKIRRIPLGLARVRKELPSPGQIFKSKKKDGRKQSKAELRRELQDSLLPNPRNRPRGSDFKRGQQLYLPLFFA